MADKDDAIMELKATVKNKDYENEVCVFGGITKPQMYNLYVSHNNKNKKYIVNNYGLVLK